MQTSLQDLSTEAGPIWRFGQAEFDETRWSLCVAGTPVALEPKPLRMLGMLLRRPGEVVTRDELLEALWPGTAVVDKAVTNAVAKLRQALGADAACIATVPKVGYRLTAEVCLAPPPAAPAPIAMPVAAAEPAAVVAAALAPVPADSPARADAPIPAGPRHAGWHAAWHAFTRSVMPMGTMALLCVALGGGLLWQTRQTARAEAAADAERHAAQTLQWRLVGALAQAGRLEDARREFEAMQTRLADSGERAALQAARLPSFAMAGTPQRPGQTPTP